MHINNSFPLGFVFLITGCRSQNRSLLGIGCPGKRNQRIGPVRPQIIQSQELPTQSNQTVVDVQSALNRWMNDAYGPETRQRLPEDGVFDENTSGAIRFFQQNHNMEQTGIIDQRFIDALNRETGQIQQQQQQQSTPSPPLPHRPETPRSPSTEDQLRRRQLQQQLDQTSQTFSGMAESLTERRIPAGERTRFDLIEQANNLSEGGGRYQASRRGTTAGAPASYGRSQLLTRLQVDSAVRMTNDPGVGSVLRQNHLTRAELTAMNHRGNAAMAWYDLTASSSNPTRLAESLSTNGAAVSAEQARDIRARAEHGDAEGIVRDYGDLFSRSTGLPREELSLMVNSRWLHDGRYRNEFNNDQRQFRTEYQNQLRQNRQSYQQEFSDIRRGLPRGTEGNRQALDQLIQRHNELQTAVSENPTLRNNRGNLFTQGSFRQIIQSRDELNGLRGSNQIPDSVGELATYGATSRLASNHQDVREVLQAHGGMDQAMTGESISRYFRDRRLGENRNGWYTRGAMTHPAWNNFERVLPDLDIYTTRDRSIQNYGRARQVAEGLAGWSSLSEQDQTRLIGAMARINHAGSGHFQSIFLGPNALTSAGEVQQLIRYMVDGDREALQPYSERFDIGVPTLVDRGVGIRNWERNLDRVSAE